MQARTRVLAVPAGGTLRGMRVLRLLRGIMIWARLVLRLIVGLVLLPLLVLGLVFWRVRWRLIFRRELRRCGVPAAAARELVAAAEMPREFWHGWRKR
ncbi:MAG: hypothetical protein QM296_01415 [Bacillota bacterium]|nr:hypothetical protein [Bacillota bacterium]